MRRSNWATSLRMTGFAFALVAITVACAVKWTPEYDAVLDRSVTSFQESVEGYLNQLESVQAPACTFDNNKSFYDKARVQLATMRTRADASVHPQQLQIIVGSLSNTLDIFEKLQKDAGKSCLTPAVIEPSRQAFEREFEAMLAYELALKANRPPATAPTKQ